MIKRILAVLLLALTLCSCDDINKTNLLIADSNNKVLISFSEGMVACGENAACQVALSAAYFSGAGKQQLMRPDTVVDYIKAGIPIVSLGLETFKIFHFEGQSGDNQGFVISGNNNQVTGFNKLTADRESSIESSFDSTASVENLVYTQAQTQSSSNGTGSVENVENDNSTQRDRGNTNSGTNE